MLKHNWPLDSSSPNIKIQKFFLASDYELRGYSEIFGLDANSLRSLLSVKPQRNTDRAHFMVA